MTPAKDPTIEKKGGKIVARLSDSEIGPEEVVPSIGLRDVKSLVCCSVFGVSARILWEEY